MLYQSEVNGIVAIKTWLYSAIISVQTYHLI